MTYTIVASKENAKISGHRKSAMRYIRSIRCHVGTDKPVRPAKDAGIVQHLPAVAQTMRSVSQQISDKVHR
jgi:hypothetical protein